MRQKTERHQGAHRADCLVVSKLQAVVDSRSLCYTQRADKYTSRRQG